MNQLTFRNGDKIDAIGLGTWKSEPGDVYKAVIANSIINGKNPTIYDGSWAEYGLE